MMQNVSNKNVLLRIILILIVFSIAPRLAASQNNLNSKCPVSLPNFVYEKDGSYNSDHFGSGNFGSGDLSVHIPPNGMYDNIGMREHEFPELGLDDPVIGIRQKFAWYGDLQGEFSMSGERLDGVAEPLFVKPPGTNYKGTGYYPTIIVFPSPGCWKVTGSISETKTSFVILIREPEQ